MSNIIKIAFSIGLAAVLWAVPHTVKAAVISAPNAAQPAVANSATTATTRAVDWDDYNGYWGNHWRWYDRDYAPYYHHRFRRFYGYAPYYGHGYAYRPYYDYGPYYGGWYGYGPRVGVRIGPLGFGWWR